MAATNADDSMAVAVETPNAEEDDISDIENEFDYLFRKRLMLRASPIPLGLLTRVMRDLQDASLGLNYRRWELDSSRHRAHR